MASGIPSSSTEKVTGRECAAIVTRGIDQYEQIRPQTGDEKPPMLVYQGKHLSVLLPAEDDCIVSIIPGGCSMLKHPEIVDDSAFLEKTMPPLPKHKRRFDAVKQNSNKLSATDHESREWLMKKQAKARADASPCRGPSNVDDGDWVDIPIDDMEDQATSRCDDATIGDTDPLPDLAPADVDLHADMIATDVDITLSTLGIPVPMSSEQIASLHDGVVNGQPVSGLDGSILDSDEVKKELAKGKQTMAVFPDAIPDDTLANDSNRNPDEFLTITHRHHALWRLCEIAKSGGGETITRALDADGRLGLTPSPQMARLGEWAKTMLDKPFHEIIEIFRRFRQSAIADDQGDDSWKQVISLIQLTIPDFMAAIIGAFPGADLRMSADDTMPAIEDENDVSAVGLQFSDVPIVVEIKGPCNYITTMVHDWYSTLAHGTPIHVTINAGNGWLGDVYAPGASISNPGASNRNFSAILPAPIGERYPPCRVILPMSWSAIKEDDKHANVAVLHPNTPHYRLLFDSTADELKSLADERASRPQQPGAILVGLSLIEMQHPINSFDPETQTMQITNPFCRAFWTMSSSWDADPMLMEMMCKLGQCEPGPELVTMLRKQLLPIFLVLPPAMPIPHFIFQQPNGGLAHIMRAMQAGVPLAIANQDRFCNGPSSRGSYWVDPIQPLQADAQSMEGFGTKRSATILQQMPHDLGVAGSFAIVQYTNTERKLWSSIPRNKARLFHPMVSTNTATAMPTEEAPHFVDNGEYLWLAEAREFMKSFRPIYPQESIIDLTDIHSKAHDRKLHDVHFPLCQLRGPTTSEATTMSVNPTSISIQRASS